MGGLFPFVLDGRICPQEKDVVFTPTRGEAYDSPRMGFVVFISLRASVQHSDLPGLTMTTMIKTIIANIY